MWHLFSALRADTFQQLQDFEQPRVGILGFLYVTLSFLGITVPVILYLVSHSELAQGCFTPVKALELPLLSKALSLIPRIRSHCHYKLFCVGTSSFFLY